MSVRLMVETSALVAIILEEPGWPALADQVLAGYTFTSCINVFEATLAVAAARHAKARLLYVGEDFARTDVNDDL